MDPQRPRHARLLPSAYAMMTFVRTVTTLAALSSPMLLSTALGLTSPRNIAKTATVSPSLSSTTMTPSPSVEAYGGKAGLLSSPWIRTDDPVVQGMLYSAPWVRSGAANSGEPLGCCGSLKETGSSIGGDRKLHDDDTPAWSRSAAYL